MLTYDEAKEIALGRNDRVNACNEYAKAYHFFYETEEEIDGDSGVVVLKDTGKAIGFISFILDYHPEKTPKRIADF